MVAVLLSVLFVVASMLAVAVIADSWLRYGETMLALRGQLALVQSERSFHYSVHEVRMQPRSLVTALRTRPAIRLRRPVTVPALRAAA